MLVRLSRHDCFYSFNVVSQKRKNVDHDVSNIFNFSDQKTFTSRFVRRDIRAKAHTRVKTFVGEERDQLCGFRKTIVVEELDHGKPFKPVVLHVVAVFSKMRFDILISSLDLIVRFEIMRCKKTTLNTQALAEELSNNDDELRISI